MRFLPGKIQRLASITWWGQSSPVGSQLPLRCWGGVDVPWGAFGVQGWVCKSCGLEAVRPVPRLPTGPAVPRSPCPSSSCISWNLFSPKSPSDWHPCVGRPLSPQGPLQDPMGPVKSMAFLLVHILGCARSWLPCVGFPELRRAVAPLCCTVRASFSVQCLLSCTTGFRASRLGSCDGRRD